MTIKLSIRLFLLSTGITLAVNVNNGKNTFDIFKEGGMHRMAYWKGEMGRGGCLDRGNGTKRLRTTDLETCHYYHILYVYTADKLVDC